MILVQILLIFIDGLGLGEDDGHRNPLVTAATPTWRRLLGGSPLIRAAAPHFAGGVSLVPTDCTLGVPGLPQSATGQTAILTGQNGARVLGRHHNAYPPQPLRELIARDSILKKVLEGGYTATFANAFTPEYFQLVAAGKRRHSVTTEVTLAAGLPLRQLEDLREGRAVYQDITNESLRERGHDVPIFSPEEAGAILARLSQEYNFTLFEYFQTDRVGHSGNRDWAERVLNLLDRFYAAVLAGVDLEKTLVVLTSDHGNIEDLSVETHTANPVPTLRVGRRHREAAARIRTLTDIAPALLALLDL